MTLAENHMLCAASPETVFKVLCDPRSYSYFVVGTRTIRHFDSSWPEVGSCFHHSLGVGITLVRDMTESLEVVEGRRLAMRAHMRLVATNDVVFDLTPQDGGTLVTLTETAVGGFAGAPRMRAAADRMFYARNVWVLRRLRAVVERRQRRLAQG